MPIIEVTTPEHQRRFRELAVTLHGQEPAFVRPLDKDIEAVFDPKQNKFFRKGEAVRWLLTDSAGKDIGRMATFVNKQYKQEQPTGGVGFFECINDQAAANAMFDHAKAWLQSRGMEGHGRPHQLRRARPLVGFAGGGIPCTALRHALCAAVLQGPV